MRRKNARENHCVRIFTLSNTIHFVFDRLEKKCKNIPEIRDAKRIRKKKKPLKDARVERFLESMGGHASARGHNKHCRIYRARSVFGYARYRDVWRHVRVRSELIAFMVESRYTIIIEITILTNDQQ